jgi:hypothetical protein
VDILGHLLLGAAVAGKVTPYTVALSVAPDLIGALPLQFKHAWRKPPARLLLWYKLWHSPLVLFVAFFLPSPAFLLISTHVIADMFTHEQPYSDFPIFQWDYSKPVYWLILLTLGVITWLRIA